MGQVNPIKYLEDPDCVLSPIRVHQFAIARAIDLEQSIQYLFFCIYCLCFTVVEEET